MPVCAVDLPTFGWGKGAVMNARFGTLQVVLPMLAASLVVGSACSLDVLGPLGGVHGEPDEIVGEVRSVDTRRGHMHIRDAHRWRTWTVYYDRRTRVYYRGRRYPVSGLRRGDDVRIRLDYDRHGRAWADRVEIRGGGW